MKKLLSPWQQKTLQAYQRNVQHVLGLAPSSCHSRFREVREFLQAVPIRRGAHLTELTPVHVVRYLTARSADYAPATLHCVASSVRDFLRFAHQRGWLRQRLDLAVPKIASGTHNDLPFHLSRPQLAALLASWDRATAEGRRDLAIGLCLARLGLRAGEVAALLLEDIHWRQGLLHLRHSKNHHQAQVPLLAEVGEALARYLRAGRPACVHRQVFLLLRRPRPMNIQAVSGVIARALLRCGIAAPHPGAHLLRHTLASHLIQEGASLKDVADVLRHRDLNSASVYAHVAVPQLRAVAQPWPQEANL